MAAWAIAALLAAGQFTFLLALAPLAGIGIWFQSEPVSAANAGLAGLVLAILALNRAGTRRPPLSVLVLLAMAGWSAAALPFAVSAAGSWLGTPQSGHGVGWLLTVAALAMGASSLRHRKAPQALLVAAMAAGAAVMIALNRWAPMAWRPQHFTDAGAFNALFAWMAIMAWRPRRPLVAGLAGLGLVGLVFLSDNRSAYLALLAGVLCFAGAAWANRKPFGRWAMAALPPLAAVSLTLGVFVLGRYGILHDVPHSLRDTVVSRANMIRVVAEELRIDPLALLTGRGWGSFDVALARSMALDHVALQSEASDEFLFWDAAHRNDFHPHNEVVEATLSAGVPAGIAVAAFLGLLVHGASRRFRPAATGFSVALAVLSCMWFQLPTSVPAFGAAVGLIGLSWRRAGHGQALRRALGAGAVLLVATSAALWLRAEAGRREFAAIPPDDCRPLLAGQARIHAVWLIQTQWHHLSDVISSKAPTDEVAVAAEHMRRRLCAADTMALARDGLPLAVEGTIIRSDLAAQSWPAASAGHRAELLSPLKDGLVRTLAMAPRRSDLAAPYLSSLLAGKREAEVSEFVARHLPADDPVGLWYAGIVMLGNRESFPEGIRKLQKAMHMGVERFIMIPPELKTQIASYR
ncbi:O-antigen ligase family protein [Paramagnetospirillum caucaseum]|nr:O-antigen ligase family protein [Paramagnetospirillum caucaseum]